MRGVAAISAGGEHSMIVTTNGELWAWGDNRQGQLGIPWGSSSHSIPELVMEENVVAVSAGGGHSMAITSDGGLWIWGDNSSGQLGHGTLGSGHVEHLSPFRLMDDVAAISAGSRHSMAIKTDNSLWAWGHNSYGQLGDGTNQFRENPVRIMGDVVAVSAGNTHTMAITSDGVLWGWGENTSGEILDDSIPRHTDPVRIVSDVAAVSAGNGYTVALFTNGEVWGWGWNAYGQLGVGYATDSHGIDRIMSITEHGGESVTVSGSSDSLSVERIRLMVRDYVPQFGGNYSLHDIPDSLLSEYIGVLRSKGFMYEAVRNAALVAFGVGEGTIHAMYQQGYEQITHTAIDNMEYQVGFRDTASGVEVMISFNGTGLFSPRDWTANTNRPLVNGVHRGYSEMAEKLINDGINVRFHASDITTYTLADLIESPNTRFTLIGHSMGGAIAGAYAIHLMNNGVSSERIQGISFNSALVITESQQYYPLDMKWFNIMNRTDNVSAGAVWFSLEADGRRLGYDVPLNDPSCPNRHYALNTLFPNGEHGMGYLWDILTHENTKNVLAGG